MAREDLHVLQRRFRGAEMQLDGDAAEGLRHVRNIPGTVYVKRDSNCV